MRCRAAVCVLLQIIGDMPLFSLSAASSQASAALQPLPMVLVQGDTDWSAESPACQDELDSFVLRHRPRLEWHIIKDDDTRLLSCSSAVITVM